VRLHKAKETWYQLKLRAGESHKTQSATGWPSNALVGYEGVNSHKRVKGGGRDHDRGRRGRWERGKKTVGFLESVKIIPTRAGGSGICLLDRKE